MSHSGAEGEAWQLSHSQTAEKYMNTDAVDVTERAAGTRTVF